MALAMTYVGAIGGAAVAVGVSFAFGLVGPAAEPRPEPTAIIFSGAEIVEGETYAATVRRSVSEDGKVVVVVRVVENRAAGR